MRGAFKIAVAALLCLIFYAKEAKAHPHVFIQYNVSVFASDQSVLGFYVSWDFDEMFSKDLIRMFDVDSNGYYSTAEIQKIYKTAFLNLRKQNYFLDVVMAGKSYKIDRVSDFEASIMGDKVQYAFFVPFKINVTKVPKTLKLYIYDSSYYMDVEPYMPFEVDVVGKSSISVESNVDLDDSKPYYFDQVFPYCLRLKLQVK